MSFPLLPAPRAQGLLRIIAALLLAAALGGCSAIKLGYSTAPELAYWWLQGYVDLGDEQAPRVREELARLHAWHRANELPLIADTLGRMAPLAAGSVSAAQACAFEPEVRARLNAVFAQAEPAIVSLAATLNARQLRALERRFARKNAEWRSEQIEAPAAERQEKRYREWLDRMEMFYGTPDDTQRALLREMVARSAYDPQHVLQERQRRQQDLLQVLRKLHDKPDAAQARALVHGWFERVQRSPDAAYRDYEQAIIRQLCANIAQLHESANAEQRARAARRLRAYERDLRELAAPR
jgi:hypothetical protein